MAIQKKNTDGRSKQGKVASLVGIIINVILGIGKIAIGSIFGVISLFADGINNLTDSGNNIISMVSFKLSSRPADKEHPYGHERVEYICALAVSFLILLVAFDTIKESITRIIEPTEIEFSIFVIVALCVSIVAKFGLFFYYRGVAKKIDSSILKAGAVDSLVDCISTGVVLISVLVGKFAKVNIDGYAGILVALFIGWSAIGILREIFSKLIGQAPDQEMINEIKDKIKGYEGVLDVHDLAVYSYGPNKYFASVHVEVDANIDVLVSHELLDDIERDFIETTNVVLTCHLDPVVIDDERVNALKVKVIEAVKTLDPDFSIHDFRMVFGERHTNVLFDVAIHFDTKLTKDEIVNSLTDTITAINPQYRAIITVEHTI